MHQHVTVVPADNLVIVDGEALRFAYAAPDNLRAIQWHDGQGHMEWTDDLNHPISGAGLYAQEVAPFVALWEAEMDRLLAQEDAQWQEYYSLPAVKGRKKAEIYTAFMREEEEGFVPSALGFRADATRRSKADIDGLVQVMEAMGMASVAFRDFDNAMHELTLEQIKALRLEVIQKGLWNYQHKWELEAALDAAQTRAEVAAIAW